MSRPAKIRIRTKQPIVKKREKPVQVPEGKLTKEYVKKYVKQYGERISAPAVKVLVEEATAGQVMSALASAKARKFNMKGKPKAQYAKNKNRKITVGLADARMAIKYC